MKNKLKLFGVIAIVAIIGFTMIACNKSGSSNSVSSSSNSDSSKSSGGGGKSFNSAEELKEYLDKQPANSPDNPIKISMSANELMLPKIRDVLNTAGKYVNLNFSGNVLKTISDFNDCKTLVSINISNSVTSIEGYAFQHCSNLKSITIPNSVTNIGISAFDDCNNLTNITIPASVTNIKVFAFNNCTSLTSVVFQGTIISDNFGSFITNWEDDEIFISPFFGDLRDKYLTGGIGTYTTTTPVNDNSKWIKQ